MKKNKLKYKTGGKIGFGDVAGLASAFVNPISAIPSALNLIGKLAYNPASYTPAKMNESPMGYAYGGDMSGALQIAGGNDQQMGDHAVQVEGNPGVDTNYRNIGGQDVALTQGEIVRQDQDGSAYVWSNNPKMKHPSGETFAKAMKPIENKIARLKSRIQKDHTDVYASNALGHLEQMIEQNKNEEESLRQLKGSPTAQAFNKGGKVGEDPIYSGGTLPEATIKAKQTEIDKLKTKFKKENPKEKYIDAYLKSPLAQGTGNSIVNYPKRLDTDYEKKLNDYVTDNLIKNKYASTLKDELSSTTAASAIWDATPNMPQWSIDEREYLVKQGKSIENETSKYNFYRNKQIIDKAYPTFNDKAQAVTSAASMLSPWKKVTAAAQALNVGLELVKKDPNYSEAVLGAIPLGQTGKKGGAALFKIADKFYDVQDVLPADSKLKIKQDTTMKKNKGGYIKANDGIKIKKNTDPTSGLYGSSYTEGHLIPDELMAIHADEALRQTGIGWTGNSQLTPLQRTPIKTSYNNASPKIQSPLQRLQLKGNSPFTNPSGFIQSNPSPLTSITGKGLPNLDQSLSTFEDKAFLGTKALETTFRVGAALDKPTQYDTRRYNVDRIRYSPQRALDANQANYQGAQFDINTGNANTDRILRNNLYGQKMAADRDVIGKNDQMQNQSDLQVNQYNAQAKANVDNITEQIRGRDYQATDAALTSIGNLSSIFQQAGGAKAHNRITMSTLNSLSRRYGIDVPELMALMQGEGDLNKGTVKYKGK